MNPSLLWNYNALLDEGIKLIELFSSRNWTDYNIHDPGITTLEFLCYALTDLAGRVGLPLTSHLAEKNDQRVRLRTDFPQAHKILPCGAVTLNDYRKLLIDLPGIRNAWLYPVNGLHPPMYAVLKEERLSFEGEDTEQVRVRGCYDVKIEFEKTIVMQQKDQLKKQVAQTLMANRNLCEDFNRIDEVGLEEIAVCIDVELTLDSDVDEVKAEILFRLDEFISPTLRRYTLQEMLAKGYPIEEIINGPFLENGFIEDSDLTLSHNRGELHTSDMIQLLMDIPQVVAVRRLLITTYQDDEVVVLDEIAIVPLSRTRASRFSPEKSRFRFFKENIPYISIPAIVERYLAQIRSRRKQAPIETKNLRPELPEAEYVALSAYTSIQHHFPQNYMVGPEGVSPHVSVERKAAVKQFKAYLALFEQFLADLNAQIQHAMDLLSPSPVKRSYAHALPSDIPDFAGLIRDVGKIADYYEDPQTFQRRRNQFLDHLLARFGEQYREYSMLVQSAYETNAFSLLIEDKERLLNHLETLSAGRFRGVDYTLRDPDKTISGLERKLRVLLGYTSDIDISVRQEQHFEIYDEQDDDGIDEFRFRIVDGTGKIMLSSTRHMHRREDVAREMRKALIRGTNPVNYRISPAEDGRWHFTLHDENGDMLGRRIDYFETENECITARDACILFLRSLFPEGDIFVLEHMLLRPCFFDDDTDLAAYTVANDDRYLLPTCFDDDDENSCCNDPYSFRITVIMPAWPKRFRDMNFRNFLSRFIREQTPAHIQAKVCWISSEQLNEFQTIFEAWKAVLAIRTELPEPSVYLNALEQLIGVWRRLRNVYPPVHLYDCREIKGITPTVLGDSTLGDMNGADDDQD